MTQQSEDEIYEELAEEEAPRDLIVPEEGDDGHKTLTERMEEQDMSDWHVAIARLFPEFEAEDIKELSSAVVVARIAPDVFLDMLRLTVISIIRRKDPKKPIYPMRVINMVYSLMSIGLDGKGRIDLLELAGAMKESEELKDLGKGLGI